MTALRAFVVIPDNKFFLIFENLTRRDYSEVKDIIPKKMKKSKRKFKQHTIYSAKYKTQEEALNAAQELTGVVYG